MLAAQVRLLFDAFRANFAESKLPAANTRIGTIFASKFGVTTFSTGTSSN